MDLNPLWKQKLVDILTLLIVAIKGRVIFYILHRQILPY
jgi:hypothetical protein